LNACGSYGQIPLFTELQSKLRHAAFPHSYNDKEEHIAHVAFLSKMRPSFPFALDQAFVGRYAALAQDRFYNFLKRPDVLLILVTLFPRLLLFALLPWIHTDPFGGSGHDGYLQLAQSLAHNGSYSFDGAHAVTTRAPLTSVLLVPGILLRAPELWTLSLQLLLSIGTVLTIRWSALLLGADETAATLCAAIFGLNPWFIWFCKNPMTYVASAFLVSVVVAVYLFALTRNRRPIVFATLGLLCGLAALTHPSCALLVPGIVISRIIWNRATLKNITLEFVVLASSFVLTLSPWITRNYFVTRRFIPTVDGAGFQYLIGKSLYENRGRVERTETQFAYAARLLRVRESDLPITFHTLPASYNLLLDRLAREDFVDTLKQSPQSVLKRAVLQFAWLWVGDSRPLLRVAHFIYVLPIVVALSTAVLIGSGRKVLWLLAIIAPVVLLHCLVTSYIPHAAYSIPLVVVLVLGVALCPISEWLTTVNHRWRDRGRIQ
jgi:4-amino-4-deoxy-L-arabinose transferase-like glycosyltransferase